MALTTSSTNRPAASLRSVQIIPLAMALGVLAISGVAIAVRLSGGVESNPEVTGVLTMAVAALAVAMVPVYFVLRRTLVARAQEERAKGLELLAQGQAPPALLTLLIVGAALAEGVGLFGAVTLLIGGPWFVLAAPGLALALILMQIPTRERFEAMLRG